mgnify:CR=1 FL=1
MSEPVQDPDTIIISSIKDPWKLLVLDIDIAMGVAPTAFLGFILKHELIGLAIAVAVAYKWQTSRNNNPKGFAFRWLWWHTPASLWRMFTHVCPPSHKREFIG